MSENWLLLDVGNTHTVAGLHRSSASRPVEKSFRFRTDSLATADEYRASLYQLCRASFDGDVRFDRVIISSVVPGLDSVLSEALSPARLTWVTHELKREFELMLPQPAQLGADRLANLAGALTIAKAPLLVVDAGTATTFCLLDRDRRYLGGAITPGLEISWKALGSRAAKLFSVELKRPELSIGNTTETQIQSGVLIGYEALIEGMTDRLLSEAGSALSGATLIATGGCIRPLQLSKRFRIEPDLTLLGLIRYGQLS